MENKPTFKFSLIIIISCLCMLLPDLIGAQDKNIYEITENPSSNDRQDFYDLAFNLNTTVYLEANMIKNTYGNGAFIKVTMKDTQSFELLVRNQSDYKEAELITIQVNSINELNRSVDLTSLTEMNGLKYIFLKCSFKCQPQEIENFIKVNPNTRVFYSAQNPS